MRYLLAGDRGLVVEFGDRIDPLTHRRVLFLFQQITRNPIPGLQEAIPTYRSLLILYDPLVLSLNDLRARVDRWLEQEDQAELQPGRRVQIPVCYGGELGPDLEFVANFNGLSPEEVIQLHSSAEYLVYMLGFTPGFPMMGGLPEKLHTPRLPDPRLKVPGGSVGIGGQQTGIYSVEGPGGWRIIGRTPLRLFDPARPDPFLLQAGDLVQFQPVSRQEYEALCERVEPEAQQAPLLQEGALAKEPQP
ncbi:MAG: 5-oxoprolinase subunit PxpB [Acidobacteria bacterium]|nr:5-oxoprolinase subunit PxpB [Acidobacteriota bacterium]